MLLQVAFPFVRQTTKSLHMIFFYILVLDRCLECKLLIYVMLDEFKFHFGVFFEVDNIEIQDPSSYIPNYPIQNGLHSNNLSYYIGYYLDLFCYFFVLLPNIALVGMPLLISTSFAILMMSSSCLHRWLYQDYNIGINKDICDKSSPRLQINVDLVARCKVAPVHFCFRFFSADNSVQQFGW